MPSPPAHSPLYSVYTPRLTIRPAPLPLLQGIGIAPKGCYVKNITSYVKKLTSYVKNFT